MLLLFIPLSMVSEHQVLNVIWTVQFKPSIRCDKHFDKGIQSLYLSYAFRNIFWKQSPLYPFTNMASWIGETHSEAISKAFLSYYEDRAHLTCGLLNYSSKSQFMSMWTHTKCWEEKSRNVCWALEQSYDAYYKKSNSFPIHFLTIWYNVSIFQTDGA